MRLRWRILALGALVVGVAAACHPKSSIYLYPGKASDPDAARDARARDAKDGHKAASALREQNTGAGTDSRRIRARN